MKSLSSFAFLLSYKCSLSTLQMFPVRAANVSRSCCKCFLPSVIFMFPRLKHVFTALEHVFTALKHMFPDRKQHL